MDRNIEICLLTVFFLVLERNVPVDVHRRQEPEESEW